LFVVFWNGGGGADADAAAAAAAAASRSQLSAVGDDDLGRRLSAVAADSLDGLDHVQSLDDAPKDDVFSVEPLGLHRAEEKLGSVGSRPCICHRQDARAGMLQLEVLISEFGAIDALAAGSVSPSEVSALAHEIGDDAMESGSLEVERLAGLSGSLFASAQSSEIFGGLGDDVSRQLHHNSSCGLAADRHVEENART